ncbi:cyclase family protein [Rhodopirellula baltica]|uniref:Probable polyketide cyclase n=1 Tax=Rhodopirellula baltica (strain DSM 10527 / NCIMB 13988 / SH1) TaxID=243090 RepID=Q7UTW0_RHOBA|nr:cyclase family protein [Rhodopirellula baltica]CAD73324.1 probable polyketide cyclase [Rhodopirellula baltica SH 1]
MRTSRTMQTACLAIIILMTGQVIAQEKHKERSPWGPHDQIGAMNYLTPETVLSASKLVTKGKVYSLGMTVDNKTPAFRHRYFQIETMQPEPRTFGENKFTYVDDQLIGWTGVGSQINGLAHYGNDNVHYNGHKVSDFLTISGVKELGLEKVPPMVARGVMLDMKAHLGKEIIPEGTVFTVADIEEVAKKQGVAIRKGDVVLFRTGWARLMGVDNKRYLAGGPGVGVEAARYLAEKGVVAIGADNWSFEAVPHEDDKLAFPVNQLLATEYGVHVLENILSDELAEDDVYEFMFVLGHAKFRGTTQMQINPVAIR